MSAEQERLEAAIGYSFRDPGLLRRALTHKSYAHEQPATADAVLADNEQLEFLGDAILGFLASELLVNRFPALAEGRLSKLKSRLVSADHLHKVALSLDLGRHLVLGKGEEMSGGRAKPALLADALEALLAAIYLDADLEEVRGFVFRYVAIGLDSTLPLADYKSAVQEAAQARGLPTPRYVTVAERGPEHSKSFTVEVRVGSDWSAEAEERTKKSAGQKAAQLLLAKLQQIPTP
jgi:ribonuclease-3